MVVTLPDSEARIRARRLDELDWRKASRCQSGECVEVLQVDEAVLLRESAHPDAILRVAAASWRIFTDAIRAGEFDQLG